MKDSEHIDSGAHGDEELIAWLLNDSSGERCSRSELERGDPGTTERLQVWEDLLAACRSELRPDPSSQPAANTELAKAILASTTREDVTWRGDFGLVKSFMGHRLHASALLRVLAASLLLHIATLPVLAYYTFIAPKHETLITVEPTGSAADLPYGETEEEPTLEPDQGTWPEVDALMGVAAAPEWMREHTLDGLDLRQSAPRAIVWKSEVGLVLRAETLLIEHASDSHQEAPVAERERLEFTLGELRACVESLRENRANSALRPLAASAWLRARAAGLVALDEPLEGACRTWIGAQKPLAGAVWYRALRAAEEELADRGN